MHVDDLDTPVPVVDLDAVERNLVRAARYFAERGIALRPHIKTHKIVELARRQVELGACGITCQKLGEAEVMANGGVDNILLTFPVIGASKLTRLTGLARRLRMSVVTDSIEVATPISSAAAAAGVRIDLLVECDVGGARCGVQSPADAVALAKRIAPLPGVGFAGLMTYPPKGQIEATRAWLAAALDGLAKAGLEAPTVTVGGTPDMYRAHDIGISTEHRPGTYIYSDRSMMHFGVGTLDDCALKILATVVSRPTPDRAIIDAGSKTLSSDLMGFPDHGLVVEYPRTRLDKLSEEHGHMDLSGSPDKPKIGERLTIIPNHACAVSNLFDEVQAISGRHVVKALPVSARGMVR